MSKKKRIVHVGIARLNDKQDVVFIATPFRGEEITQEDSATICAHTAREIAAALLVAADKATHECIGDAETTH